MAETRSTRRASADGFVVQPSRDGRTIHVSKGGRTVVAEPTPKGLEAAKSALEYRSSHR